MPQPKWTTIANLGDVNPIDHGGFFVLRDTTGVYPEEAEWLVVEGEDDENCTWMVYRFILDRCTLVNGVLSDNKYHPEHPAWFAQPESQRSKRPQDTTYLSNVAGYVGITVEELQGELCSDDPIHRAVAYRSIGEYHGWENLDSYPLTFTDRAEVEGRYKQTVEELKALKRKA